MADVRVGKRSRGMALLEKRRDGLEVRVYPRKHVFGVIDGSLNAINYVRLTLLLQEIFLEPAVDVRRNYV